MLEIVTPQRIVFSDTVQEAVFPGEEGYFGVLAGHEPFLATLGSGQLKYRKEGIERVLAVHSGFVEVLPDKVIVLTENAELPEEIDVARAETAKQRGEIRLKNPTEGTDLDRARAAIMRAVARLTVAETMRSRRGPQPERPHPK